MVLLPPLRLRLGLLSPIHKDGIPGDSIYTTSQKSHGRRSGQAAEDISRVCGDDRGVL